MLTTPGTAAGVVLILLTADWLVTDESEVGNQKSLSCTRGAAHGFVCFIGSANKQEDNACCVISVTIHRQLKIKLMLKKQLG